MYSNAFSAVDCDFEINMCGWIIGRNFSSPVGSHLYWNLCPHLPSSNDFKDTCDNNVGFKYADPFSRHDTQGSSDTELPLGKGYRRTLLHNHNKTRCISMYSSPLINTLNLAIWIRQILQYTHIVFFQRFPQTWRLCSEIQ